MNALLCDLEDVDGMCEKFTETFLNIARNSFQLNKYQSEIMIDLCLLDIGRRDRFRKAALKTNRETDKNKYK